MLGYVILCFRGVLFVVNSILAYYLACFQLMEKNKRSLLVDFIKVMTSQGVPLYVCPMKEVRSVSCGVVVDAGTIDEDWPENAGIAHAIEHMFFQGNEQFSDSKSIAEYLENVGGSLNAGTTREATFFFNKLPSSKMEMGIISLSAMLRTPLFLPKHIETEMKNVIQEIHRAHDDHKGFLYRKATELVYNGHPLGKNTLGIEESVENFKEENFRDFMVKYYIPDNFKFVVVGNVEVGQVKEFFERYFPEKVTGRPNQRKIIPVNRREDKVIDISRQIKQCHIMFEYLMYGAADKDVYPMLMFQNMISSGMSSPLFQEVRDKLGLAYEIWAYADFCRNHGVFDLYIGTDYNRREEAISATKKVIRDSKNLEELFSKTREKMKCILEIGQEGSSRILNSAMMQLPKYGKILSYEEKIKRINALTIGDVRSAVDKYLSDDKLLMVMLVPEEK